MLDFSIGIETLDAINVEGEDVLPSIVPLRCKVHWTSFTSYCCLSRKKKDMRNRAYLCRMLLLVR